MQHSHACSLAVVRVRVCFCEGGWSLFIRMLRSFLKNSNIMNMLCC